MLENITLNQALAFFFSAAGIAVLLNRVPFWDSVPADLKKAIVFALNLLSPGVLASIRIYIPADVGDATLANLVIGVFMAAGSFTVHLIDEWLKARKDLAKLSV